MSDPILQDVMCRLMEPALLIDARRRPVFVTDSLAQLIGGEVCNRNCNHLLTPSLDDRGDGLCCWDVVDQYLALRSDGLWPVRRADGGFVHAICTLSPLDVSGVHSFIHVRIRPLLRPVGMIDTMFHSIRKHFGDTHQFEKWVTACLHVTWGVQSEWISLNNEGNPLAGMIIAGLDRTNWGGPFDVRFSQGEEKLIYRVFPPDSAVEAKVLLVATASGALTEELVMNAWAAARASTHREPTAPVQIPDSIILNVLSAREREVLICLGRGMSDGEIASELRLSIHTVKNHVRHIMDKCGTHKRVKLATLHLSELVERERSADTVETTINRTNHGGAIQKTRRLRAAN